MTMKVITYIGQNYIGQNYKGQNYIGQNFKGHNKTALKKLCLASIACLVIDNGYYSHHLHQSTQPQIKLLQDIGRESPITAYSQLLDRSITDNN